MQTLMGLGYYLVAGVFFALLGLAGHVVRAVVNLYPDRLSDKPLMDMAVSDGYDAQDHILGTEYDDFGYYKLDSRRNVTIAVLSSLALGWLAMLLATDVALVVAACIDWLFGSVWSLFLQRLGEARWW